VSWEVSIRRETWLTPF